MRIEEMEFWDNFELLRNLNDDQNGIRMEWLVRLRTHKLERTLGFQKRRKLEALAESVEDDVVARFTSRLEQFEFREQ